MKLIDKLSEINNGTCDACGLLLGKKKPEILNLLAEATGQRRKQSNSLLMCSEGFNLLTQYSVRDQVLLIAGKYGEFLCPMKPARKNNSKSATRKIKNKEDASVATKATIKKNPKKKDPDGAVQPKISHSIAESDPEDYSKVGICTSIEDNPTSPGDSFNTLQTERALKLRTLSLAQIRQILDQSRRLGLSQELGNRLKAEYDRLRAEEGGKNYSIAKDGRIEKAKAPATRVHDFIKYPAGEPIDEWCDSVCGRIDITAGRRMELEELVKSRYGLFGKDLLIFDRELARRSRVFFGSRDIPFGTKFDLNERHRKLLTACVDRICPGGDLGEWPLGAPLDHPETPTYNLDIAKDTVFQKCPHCKSRQGTRKSIFPTREVAAAWGLSQHPSQFPYLCQYGRGWHVSTQDRNRNQAQEREYYERLTRAKKPSVTSHMVPDVAQPKNCPLCMSRTRQESTVYNSSLSAMAKASALASAQSKTRRDYTIVRCEAENGWHIKSSTLW